jgi:hypothetical protein
MRGSVNVAESLRNNYFAHTAKFIAHMRRAMQEAENLKSAVWESDSPCYVPNLRAVMVSYADFHAIPARRKRAMQVGLHALLGVPAMVKIYLDNGAF